MRVAIDGPAGAGKTTVARKVAADLGFFHLDSGAMYRALALAAIRGRVDLADDGALASLAGRLRIDFEGGRVRLDGEDVSADIRSAAVEAIVSRVSAVPAVREAMVARQRAIGAEGDVVAEGRDIGTVVWPDAEVKIFLTASLAARAARRQRQMAGKGPVQHVLEDIRRRDEKDSSRLVSPLRAAADAVKIDTTHLSIEEVCRRIEATVEERRP